MIGIVPVGVKEVSSGTVESVDVLTGMPDGDVLGSIGSMVTSCA